MTSLHLHWKKQARYDLDTAEAMMKTKRLLYVLFCCQQAVEKMLKALIVQKTELLPPRIHNLMQLAEHAGVTLPEANQQFYRELASYYIPARYPDEFGNIASNINAKKTREIMKQTRKALQCLELMIKP